MAKIFSLMIIAVFLSFTPACGGGADCSEEGIEKLKNQISASSDRAEKKKIMEKIRSCR